MNKHRCQYPPPLMVDLYEFRIHSTMGRNIKRILCISQNFQYQIYNHIYGGYHYRGIGKSLQTKTLICFSSMFRFNCTILQCTFKSPEISRLILINYQSALPGFITPDIFLYTAELMHSIRVISNQQCKHFHMIHRITFRKICKSSLRMIKQIHHALLHDLMLLYRQRLCIFQRYHHHHMKSLLVIFVKNSGVFRLYPVEPITFCKYCLFNLSTHIFALWFDYNVAK